VAQPSQEWFLSTPALWFAGVTLTFVLRGPLRSAPAFIRKILKFATVSLFALGFALLLLSNPVQKAVKHSAVLTAFWVVLSGLTPIAWIVLAFRVFSRRQPRVSATSTPQSARPALYPSQQTFVHHVPNDRFADLGGMDDAKNQIWQMVEAHLRPERSKRYGLSRNGILLYGPRGTGKTLLARATTGEFGLSLAYVSAPTLLNRWIGATGENIHAAFADAAARHSLSFSSTRSTRLVQDDRMSAVILAAPGGNSTTSRWH
jgi:ATPase family protein associated with various cellular activities (AAA)